MIRLIAASFMLLLPLEASAENSVFEKANALYRALDVATERGQRFGHTGIYVVSVSNYPMAASRKLWKLS